MESDKLKSILEKHTRWLISEQGGEKADLRGADLRGAYLRGAYLRGAYLQGADLREADLLTFQFQKHQAYCTGERLIIGCEDRSLSEWASEYETIGKKHGYSDLQIKAYKAFIDICIEAVAGL